MPIGPGKYDHECSMIREGTGADATFVIVVGGSRGSGFSAQIDATRPELLAGLPDMLRTLAVEIERSRD